jgi:5-methylcytosine-specific restriction endonuclease McrA
MGFCRLLDLQKCRVCGSEFSLIPEHWHREPKAKSGLKTTCKTCASERAKQWREDNPERYRSNYLGRKRSPEFRRAEYESSRGKRREYFRRYYEQNGEKLRERQREYKAQNREAINKRKMEAYYSIDPEVRRAKSAAQYAANREEQLAKHREYYRANAERIKLAVREYNAANLDAKRDRDSAYREKNRGRINATNRAWKAANPEHVRALVARYEARRRAATGRITAKDVRAQYETQRGTCFYCQRSLAHAQFHVDHFVPLSKGGTNEPENIVLACPRCNLSKHDKLPHEFTPAKE